MDLHFIAPQFLAWFYPANGEIFHSVGMLAFGRDLLSPLLNLGWFVGCLVACWCVGWPYRVGAWSLLLGAVALSVPALSDQAGEARNDIVGIFFLLAAVAIALNAWATRDEGERGSRDRRVRGHWARRRARRRDQAQLPPAGGGARRRPRRDRPAGRALAGACCAAGLAALAGGGYWYLRNLVHSGNPLPWVHHLGPISLPAPEQALGGREAHSVLGYLTDGTVWSDWFLPGLHHGLWIVWPLLGPRRPGRPRPLPGPSAPARLLRVAGLVGLATALAWLVAPTSASGPDGMPRGFESGLRYLAPALVLGLALLPATPPLHDFLARFGLRQSFVTHRGTKDCRTRRGWLLGAGAALILLAIAIGYPVQRHYLQSRYADPTFTTPGLNAAFAWADDISDARIATTSTRQYPLFGTDLSNHVQFIGEETSHGGFEAPTTCRAWREQLNGATTTTWSPPATASNPATPHTHPRPAGPKAPEAKSILRKPPTVVFQLKGELDPSACP